MTLRMMASLSIWLIAAACFAAPTTAHDLHGEFSQYTPQQKQWLQEQTVPGTEGHSCCNVADGTKAQEENRGNDWWVSFEACYNPGNYQSIVCQGVGPMRVPTDAVIHAPNKIGTAVVWYGWISWDPATKKGVPWIRCFIPGAGI